MMHKTNLKIVLTLIIMVSFVGELHAMGNKANDPVIKSPNGALVAAVDLNEQGTPVYTVTLNGKTVITPSALGLVCSKQSFDSGLKMDSISKVEKVSDSYHMLLGKQKDCTYKANRRIYTLKNTEGHTLQIIFQVSDDGIAFRYVLPEASGNVISVEEEKTAFTFAPDTLSWLHPMPVAKSGWSRTQPSYEEHYAIAKPIGTPSPYQQGWSFPALFKTTDNNWALICDSDVDENYCATHLGHESTGGVYKIAFPQNEEHRGPIDPVAPQITSPFKSPWRVIMIADNLNTLVVSTLMTDVAEPCKLDHTDFVKPGKAAWHWLRYGDDSSTLETVNAFLDFAQKMEWQYILVDAGWDRFIGYEKMTEFVKKAKSKGVDVILWYNSNGPWNDAPLTPKHKMHDRNVRIKEFATLQQMGVTGVKVDFFGGDKQATMQLYRDIFADAADYNIMVNCHGATIPRGWQRTFPNLVTMESVKGMEYCTFDQRNSDLQPQHCCILPFTRNVIGSMDYTPIVFDPRIRGVKLVTTPAFELALSVVFESGIQHFGLVPDEYKLMPDYVVEFLRQVPTTWDQTRLVDGFPAEYVVMARQKDNTWYIGGINGTGQSKTLTLDLSFMKANQAVLITDGDNRTFNQSTLEGKALNNPTIELKPNAGFVIVTK